MDPIPRLTDPRLLPLVPAEERNDLRSLWQLDATLVHLRLRTGQPALAQIALKWWQDALRARAGGLGLSGNPQIDGLREQIVERALRLVDAHQALTDQQARTAGQSADDERALALGWQGPSAWCQLVGRVEQGWALSTHVETYKETATTSAHRALDHWAIVSGRRGRLLSPPSTSWLFLRHAVLGRRLRVTKSGLTQDRLGEQS